MWAETLLGDYVRIEHGFAFKGEHFSETGNYVILTPGNFHEAGGFRARPGKDRFYEARFPDRYLLSKGDLIVAMTEQGEGLLGSTALIPESFMYLHNQRLGLVKEKSQVADRRFLYYLFNSDTVRQQIRNSSSGAKVRHTSPERIYGAKVRVPVKAVQQKIAAILSAYDDLIENNRRRIALLEKMAEEIYREWFVRMRFPGHEKVKIIKGVPEGWEIQKIGQLFNTSSGGTPSRESASNYDGEICWVKTGELKSTFLLDTEERITQQGLESSAAKIYPRNTIVIAMYCAMPDISILAVDSATNQACCAFFPKKGYLHYTYSYLLIKFAQNHMINFAHGAAQQNLSQELIKGFQLLVPTRELILEISRITEPIFSQVEQLMKVNTSLQKTRDLLLPRLISGKLSVEHLDIQFPPGMEEHP